MTASTKIVALQTKLAAAVALVATLTAAIAAADLPLPVKGDTVSFSFGRGDKKVEHTGRVIALSAGDNGVTYVSVLINEDTLPEIKRVPAKDVTVTSVTDVVLGADPVAEPAVEAAAPAPVELSEHDKAVADLLGADHGGLALGLECRDVQPYGQGVQLAGDVGQHGDTFTRDTEVSG